MKKTNFKKNVQELNDLALRYYNCTDAQEKKRIFEKACAVFLKGLDKNDIIENSKSLKKLHDIPNCAEIVEDACTDTFLKCFQNYVPDYNNDSTILFMAYFYKMAHYSALNSIEKTFGRKPNSEAEPEKYEIWKNRFYAEDIANHYDIKDASFDIETISEAEQTKNEQEALIGLFFGCIMQFYSHQDMTKGKNQNALTYFKTFYSGDIINFSRSTEFLCFLHKYEQLITKSYNTDFIDYILKNQPRAINEIVSAKPRLYSELNKVEIPTDKLQKEIKIPLEQIIYAYFFNISKPAVTKQYDKYEKFKLETIK